MSTGVTTRTQITNEVDAWYDSNLIERSLPALLHMRFGQPRNIPMNAGSDTVRFRKWGALSTSTIPLQEGVTPSGTQMSITEVTAQVSQYGAYVTLTDVLQYESQDAVLTETAMALGEQAGESLDEICRDVLVAGSNVQYASTATQRTEITSAMKLTRQEIKEAKRTLQAANAKPITAMIDPTANYNTVPVGRSYVGIVSEDTAYDLDDAAGWIPVEKYPSQKNVMPDEIGSLAGVRFLLSTKAKVYTAGGSGSIDVHATLILAQNAYGITRVNGMAMKNIIKPLGAAGSADPLEQRATSGWKATFVAAILDQTRIVRIEHAVSA